MCAIVDTHIIHEVFGNNSPPAGEYFYRWLKARGTVVVGGGLRREIPNKWLEVFSELLRNGTARDIPDEEVDVEEQRIRTEASYVSNDEHVLALARVSGARLLYTNDCDLQDDFRDRKILRGGKVYTTRKYPDVRATHRNLLRRTDLCMR